MTAARSVEQPGRAWKLREVRFRNEPRGILQSWSQFELERFKQQARKVLIKIVGRLRALAAHKFNVGFGGGQAEPQPIYTRLRGRLIDSKVKRKRLHSQQRHGGLRALKGPLLEGCPSSIEAIDEGCSQVFVCHGDILELLCGVVHRFSRGEMKGLVAITERNFFGRLMQLSATLKKYEELLCLPEIGTGCFARVFEYDVITALKVTSCKVTQRLFDAALANPKGWPEGLPQVKSGLGVVARDEEGIAYKGYLIERLFTAQEWLAEARRARVVTQGNVVRLNGRRMAASRSPEISQLRVVQMLAESLQPDPDLAPATAQTAFALEMASQVEGPLRDGFLYLAEFMAKGGVAFDLTTPGNLRLDCFGRVKLCDPASYAGEQSDPAQDDHYVMCDVPTSVRGFQLKLNAMAVRVSGSANEEQLVRDLIHLGLRPKVAPLSKVQAHLRRENLEAKIFEFPGAARLIQDDAYRQVLYHGTVQEHLAFLA